MEDSSLDERDAFLLGNQGPDPLFFLAIHPSLHRWSLLGRRMHRERTTDLIAALYSSLSILDEDELPVGRAYAQGFLGHFALDSHVHPLVYSTQRALCDAGIEGLSRADSYEVHAEIEREFDEMMLTSKRGQTVRDYPAVDNTLEASPAVLAVIQKIYAYLAIVVYGQAIPAGLFPSAVECYRLVLLAVHSPSGIKREIAIATERLLRPHSFIGAFSHKAQLVEDSWFANSEHRTWADPSTGEESTASFWDLYQDALESVADAIERFENSTFTDEDARAVSRNVNFAGEPIVPMLVVEN